MFFFSWTLNELFFLKDHNVDYGIFINFSANQFRYNASKYEVAINLFTLLRKDVEVARVYCKMNMPEEAIKSAHKASSTTL